jgi:flagellar basal-body rod protein FlgB
VLARNIANASTPKFQARDLPDFAGTLSRRNAGEPVRTQPNHLPSTQGAGIRVIPLRPTARGPDGNGVGLDDQLVRVADTETTQSLVTTIYRKYMSMFSMALGKG